MILFIIINSTLHTTKMWYAYNYATPPSSLVALPWAENPVSVITAGELQLQQKYDICPGKSRVQ